MSWELLVSLWELFLATLRLTMVIFIPACVFMAWKLHNKKDYHEAAFWAFIALFALIASR